MSEARPISRRRLIASGVSTVTIAALPCHFTASAAMRRDKGDGMNSFMPYLLFDGTCLQAMEFYKACLGGDLSVYESPGFPCNQSDASGTARQSHSCAPEKRQYRDCGVGLADAQPNSRSREYGLSFPECRNFARVEVAVRETIGGSGNNRSFAGAILWHLRSAQRQVRCAMDVSNHRKGLTVREGC